MKSVRVNNAVWKEGEYYVAQCLNVDLSSFADTREEALTNLQDALELYFKNNKNPDFNVIDKVEIVESVLTYA
jgi:predicted RNase H-like HicB family nuclease